MSARDASPSLDSPARGPLRKPLDGLLFLLIVPLLAHFGFSWIGFNPSDDGFILAGSRRIADGQIPHLDFISIRTVGSYLLHVPSVVLGGERAFWISRYVAWLEWGIVAWCWVILLDRLLALKLSERARLLCGLIVFMLCTHNVPISVWHTLDGLAASSLGLVLCTGAPGGARLAGFFLVGSALLFKQGYAFMVPGALVVLNGWRRPRFWVAAAAPVAIAGLALILLGALPEAIRQVGSRREIVSAGVEPYLHQWGTAAGAALGLIAMFLAFPRAKGDSAGRTASRGRILTGLLLLHAPALVAAAALWRGLLRDAPVFGLFGAAMGATLWFLLPGSGPRSLARVGALALLTAWCASISTSGIYNSPLLASGILAMLLICYGRIALERLAIERTGEAVLRRAHVALATAVLAATFIAFVTARRNFIYRERPASELTSPLDGVFPGGRGIWTNPGTFAFLQDLDEAIGKAGGTEYAIVPALAGYWARSTQPNPLSIDWAINNELHTPELVQRVIRDLESRRGRLVIIVQKIPAGALASRAPLRAAEEGPRAGKKERNEVVLYVQSKFTLTGSTDYFDLYR